MTDQATTMTYTVHRKAARLMRPVIIALPLVVALGACGGGSDKAADPPSTTSVTQLSSATSTTTASTTTTTTKVEKAWEPLSPDVQPPRFVTMGGQVPKGYKLWNGRILWVEEKSGVGRIIANPDEVNADQWTCAAILGDVPAFYKKTEDLPNFSGVVCHPYKVVTDFP